MAEEEDLLEGRLCPVCLAPTTTPAHCTCTLCGFSVCRSCMEAGQETGTSRSQLCKPCKVFAGQMNILSDVKYKDKETDERSM